MSTSRKSREPPFTSWMEREKFLSEWACGFLRDPLVPEDKAIKYVGGPWREKSMRQKREFSPQSKAEERWVVSLTERYEVAVVAETRAAAIAAVTEFGGGGPVRFKVSARLARKDEAWIAYSSG